MLFVSVIVCVLEMQTLYCYCVLFFFLSLYYTFTKILLASPWKMETSVIDLQL